MLLVVSLPSPRTALDMSPRFTLHLLSARRRGWGLSTPEHDNAGGGQHHQSEYKLPRAQ